MRLKYFLIGFLLFCIFILPSQAQVKPDSAKAHYNLGVDYSKLGRYPEAIEACKQAIRIKPDYAKAHYNLGVDYLMLKDSGSALEEYKILKNLDKDLANELFNLIYK